ncbi:MAG: DUF4340 domain-containing protein [Spirochaetaceae bacterium]
MNDRYWLRTMLAVSVAVILILLLVYLMDRRGSDTQQEGSVALLELFRGLTVEELTRIDIIGYEGEFSISGSFVRNPSEDALRPLINGSGVSDAPARADRVSVFVEELMSTEDMRLVTENTARHGELGVQEVNGPESLQPFEYVINLWSDDESHTVYLGISSTVEVVYLRSAESDSVYAAADTFSRALSLHLDWFVDHRLLQGRVRRSDVESIRFSGLADAQIDRLDGGFTADYEPGAAAEAAAATSVSRLLSLEGAAFLSEPVNADDAVMRAEIMLQDSDMLVVLIGNEREDGYPVTVVWPQDHEDTAPQYMNGIMVFDHLIEELLLSLASLQPS